MSSHEHWKSKIKAMGSNCLSIPFSMTVSDSEAAHASNGLLPRDQDDKWFGFWDDDEICFYRSWTGHQIYRIKKRKTEEGFELGPVEVLEDQSIYRRTSDEIDLRLITNLTNRLLGKN